MTDEQKENSEANQNSNNEEVISEEKQTTDSTEQDSVVESVQSQGKMVRFWTSLSAREQTIAGITSLIIIFVLMDLVMIRPLNRHLDTLNDRIQEKKITIPKKLMILKHKDRVQSTNSSFQEYLMTKDLTDEEQIAIFLRDIEGVSQKTGLFISNINPVEVNALGSIGNELAVDLEGTGNIANIKNFIQTLEELHPPIVVNGMNLRSQGANNNDLRYKFSIQKIGMRDIK